MKTAIITGASSGLGKEFAKQLNENFKEIDEFILIARRKEKLEEISKSLEGKKVVILPLDLSKDDEYLKLADYLAENKPNVYMLINNAGLGFWGSVKDLELSKQINSCDVNVKGLSAVTHIALPYMQKGSKIIFISSIASFVPNAFMTVYCSTKAYVTSYARALRYELKKEKISVTVACPGPMATEFIEVGKVESETFKKLPYCNVEKVVKGTLKKAKKGGFIYTPKLFYKFYRLLAKILPLAWLMPLSKT